MDTPAVSIELDGNVIKVGGEVDAYTSALLAEQLEAQLEAKAKRIVVDLSAVTFMDSCALQTLIEYRHRAADHGGRLVLASLSATVIRLFEITGLRQNSRCRCRRPASWASSQPHRAATAGSVETILRVHVLPTFGARPIASIRTSEVQGWVSGLELAPSTVTVVYGKLAAIFRRTCGRTPRT